MQKGAGVSIRKQGVSACRRLQACCQWDMRLQRQSGNKGLLQGPVMKGQRAVPAGADDGRELDHITVRYCTLSHSTVLYSIAQYGTVLYGTVQHPNVICGTCRR